MQISRYRLEEEEFQLLEQVSIGVKQKGEEGGGEKKGRVESKPDSFHAI